MRMPADLTNNIVMNFYSNNKFYSKGFLKENK